MTTFTSKLNDTKESIFSVMSKLARQHDAINLSQGFPNFPIDPELIELVNSAMRDGHNQYAPMEGVMALREILAEKIRFLYNRRINPEKEITITAGATQAIFTAISALIRPGDEAILIEPAYDCYQPAVILNGGTCLYHKLNKPDFRIYWEEIRRMVTEKTRLIIVNTPHNPTGQLMRWEDWDELNTLLEDFPNLYLISDEVYEHIVLNGEYHESALTWDNLFQRCFAIYSFGKTFHATGWKMGYVVASEFLMREFRKVHQFNVFSCNTPIQYALAEYIEDPLKYQSLPKLYQNKKDLMVEILDSTPLKALRCDGTYFMLADFNEMSDLSDYDFAHWITKEIGVAVIPPSSFYSDGLDESLIRICFAKTEDVLHQAGERLRKL